MFLASTLILLCGCGRLSQHNEEREYRGFLRIMNNKEQYKNTSLCKTTDDVLYSKPCEMTTVVSEEFLKGYQDSLKNKKVRVLGKSQDYEMGQKLGENDKNKESTRKFEIKR